MKKPRCTIVLYLNILCARKSFPKDVPKEIVEFAERLLRYDPTERPNWDKENLIETLSDIREKVFGRRHVR